MGYQRGGVQRNEGAMGDSDSQIWDAMGRALLPDTCYRHNSGGKPRGYPLAYSTPIWWPSIKNLLRRQRLLYHLGQTRSRDLHAAF